MTAGAWPAHWPVRVRPAPAYDPPYDEERPSDWFDPEALQPLLELPGLPGTGRRRRPGPPDRPACTGWPGQVPAGASPPTTAAAARFVNICLEIINGYRPVTHFRALSAPLAAASVLEAMTEAVHRVRPATRRGGLVKLRAMRTCEPRPGVAEIALVIAIDGGPGPSQGEPANRGPTGSRTGRTGPTRQAWGLAFRLERQPGRWQCTAAGML
jgi:hypothetical protein